jgi:hypothetical protein
MYVKMEILNHFYFQNPPSVFVALASIDQTPTTVLAGLGENSRGQSSRDVRRSSYI